MFITLWKVSGALHRLKGEIKAVLGLDDSSTAHIYTWKWVRVFHCKMVQPSIIYTKSWYIERLLYNDNWCRHTIKGQHIAPSASYKGGTDQSVVLKVPPGTNFKHLFAWLKQKHPYPGMLQVPGHENWPEHRKVCSRKLEDVRSSTWPRASWVDWGESGKWGSVTVSGEDCLSEMSSPQTSFPDLGLNEALICNHHTWHVTLCRSELCVFIVWSVCRLGETPENTFGLLWSLQDGYLREVNARGQTLEAMKFPRDRNWLRDLVGLRTTQTHDCM